MTTYAQLARSSLPPQLLRFFAAFPPGTCTSAYTNPFKPTFQSLTGKWHNPVFSLRRQAEICRLARAYGVEELLPESNKRSDIREAKRLAREERGVRVRGKKSERTLKSRLEERKRAMEGMPRLIEEWKRRGHGRGWKEWPSGKARF